MYIRRSLQILTIFIFIVLSGLGCSETERIRLAHNSWPGYEPLSLARELDLYKGVSVTIQRADSSTEVINAIKLGLIDMAALTLDEALLLQANSSNQYKIITVLDISHGGDALIAKPQIKTINALKGNRVGVEANALGAYVISRALEFGDGISINDIQIVPLTYDRHVEAFVHDDVDAVVTFEPAKSEILAHKGHVLFDSSQIPGEIIDVLVVREDTVHIKPNAVSKVVSGYFRALDYIDHNPIKANKIMGKFENMSAAEYVVLKQGMKIPDVKENRKLLGGDAPTITDSIQRLQQVMLEKQILKKTVDKDISYEANFLP